MGRPTDIKPFRRHETNGGLRRQVLLCSGVFAEALSHLFPVYDLCKIVHVFRSPVLVFEVIGVFPYVAHHERHGAPTSEILVLFGLHHY